MVSEKVRVNNPSGLHLRPAGIIFCEGEDETEALRNLVTVINNGLGE